MRFATKLEFGEKTHEVTMTAQRLVQRMMKDSIHSGRRPSGLCGAALLIAARMHDYNRTPMDIVRIVKIHESTLRKRLIEFGDTPSSMLTLDEFMAVDLEAEQDPPAFKAARKRDKERFQKLQEHDTEFTDLQREIDSHLDLEFRKRTRTKRKLDDIENSDTDEFIRSSTMDIIKEFVDDPADEAPPQQVEPRGIAPDIVAMCTPRATDYNRIEPEPSNATDTGELDVDGLDDDEIDGYIMTADESRYKDEMWNRLNAEYLKEAKAKEERLAREREEGKPEKKKRRVTRKKHIGPSNTAGEAIEKMLQEKKISSKINYDILKTLTEPQTDEAKKVNEGKSAAEDPVNAPIVIEGKGYVQQFSLFEYQTTKFGFADTISLHFFSGMHWFTKLAVQQSEIRILAWDYRWLKMRRKYRNRCLMSRRITVSVSKCISNCLTEYLSNFVIVFRRRGRF